MKIVYITAQTPYGKGEQFILPEILEIINKGHEIMVIPVRPEKEIALGNEPKKVSKFSICIPLIDINLILKSMLIFIKCPLRVMKITFEILRHSGSLKKIFKNLAIFPKGLVVGEMLRRKKTNHIHAHWGSTTSTIAYIVSQLTGIPWSFTLHRWDIPENNMLKEKARSAKFIRVISKSGYDEVLEIVGDEYKNKCFILHMGVDITKFSKEGEKTDKRDKDSFIIATPANLLEVKGHKYLIEAIETLRQKGYNIKCYFFGDGPLREELGKIVNNMNLRDIITFEGAIPHDRLLELYAKSEVDCVVLPSIITDKGEHEGIPLSLMEAMAYKIPVISTNTGGIPELLEGGAGIIVEQKNPYKLAEAIEALIKDKDLRRKLGETGYNKVMEEFSLSNIVIKLLELMKG